MSESEKREEQEASRGRTPLKVEHLRRPISASCRERSRNRDADVVAIRKGFRNEESASSSSKPTAHEVVKYNSGKTSQTGQTSEESRAADART